MIIVSQDKKRLYPFNSSIYADYDGGVGDDFVTLGIYDSEERAKQELQNIMNAYCSKLDSYEMKEE